MSLYGFWDYMFPGGSTDDLFGDGLAGRPNSYDPQNKRLFLNMMKQYVSWHEENHRFYEGYQDDKTYLKWLNTKQYLWAFGGILFMGMVFNPNYTSSRAFYLRKLNVAFGAYAGYAYGRKCKDDQLSLMLLKMNDYLPMEIRRAFESKDYRHIAMFDWKNPG